MKNTINNDNMGNYLHHVWQRANGLIYKDPLQTNKKANKANRK